MTCTYCKRRRARTDRKSCAPCADAYRKWQNDYRRRLRIDYTPIDEWAEMPRTRLLRALRFFDWVEFADLADAIGVTSLDADRNTLYCVLRRLVVAGSVERRKVRTFRGRVFEFRLKPGVVVAPPIDSAVCADEEAA